MREIRLKPVESGELLKLLLSESGIGTESDKARKLLKYLELLEKWNDRVNLTARPFRRPSPNKISTGW